MADQRAELPNPLLMPLGDSGLLVRFSDRIDEAASLAVIAFAQSVELAKLAGIVEIVPNLVSVLLRYDPRLTGFSDLAAELRLLLGRKPAFPEIARTHTIAIKFGGEHGPDLVEAATTLGMSAETFVARHNAQPLRVLSTGFAPGFVYCGLHGEDMRLPRRSAVRDRVPPGSVLFAAGQTAITSTPIPTGWHVIGRTGFSNFNAEETPPTRLRAGDLVRFEVEP